MAADMISMPVIASLLPKRVHPANFRLASFWIFSACPTLEKGRTVHAPHGEHFPLLPAQLRTWNAQIGDLTNPVFSVCDYLEIRGPVDPDLLRAAHLQVEREADALRLGIITVEGEHRQFVHPDPTPLQWVDLSARSDPAAAVAAWMAEDVHRPVDPLRLCGAAVIKTADDCFLLYWKVHHAVIDGWSLALIFNRMAAVYSALSEGRKYEKGMLQPFERLRENEAAYREGKRSLADQAHWHSKLADHPEPVGPSRRRAQVTAGRRLRHELAPDRVARLGEIADGLGVTWSDLAISAMAAYVGSTVQMPEVLLGLPTAGRLSPQVRNAVGMAMNILPLRVPFDDGSPLIGHAQRVSREVRELLLHSRYPTAELSREMTERGGSGRLWAAMVNVMLFDHRLDFAGIPAIQHTVSIPLTVDMTVYLIQIASDGTMELILDTHPDLYSAAEAEAHLAGLLSTFDAIEKAGPHTPLHALCPGPERSRAARTSASTG
ncbi:condensation domain-containing protein [Streptomyces sp. NPDC051657]|uniref:condensation domain-containing protein n=1 Tax=unclassified Streptomyces TaxID=2593676 RepID=UPI003412AB26